MERAIKILRYRRSMNTNVSVVRKMLNHGLKLPLNIALGTGDIKPEPSPRVHPGKMKVS
jgi:hypothetical protein